MIDLIVSQGRVADRAAHMIEGAALTAQALEKRYGVQGHFIGKSTPPANDDWSISLPQARETLIELRQAIEGSIKGDNCTVMLANTCSASLASLPVVAREHPDAVVLWIDAHGDFNTPETTESGYLGGMVLAAACGLWNSGHGSGLRPEQIVLVGARDIDTTEHELLQTAGVRIIPPTEATPENILNTINGSPVWIHIDWDVLEPGFLPADYTVPDGMLPSQIQAIFEAIPSKQILGIELAEFSASTDVASNEEALSIILGIIAPVFEAIERAK
ncbi:arginase family protein [Xenorhabdus bovienii]|uniref:Arginase n=1 Tax=Xenorhabdus bovienii str. oregonense TaxID=1398202 RepID=A0A077P6N0_XENBV|nr:arginase family protein [Xenorhabdus bovienii]MDE9536682.1 arginase family protein [Xenorhabdus bovienii]MDE9541118.1 arginase family protein [Xenorhabdus bovienii]MDE9589677.1 arginase family protein [Xenorhabdus bovienii]CDH06770.1 Arginase [Xenorhabdus bovienii str. oregonense]